MRTGVSNPRIRLAFAVALASLVHCDRRPVHGEPAQVGDAASAASGDVSNASTAAIDASRTITSIGFSNHSRSGDVGVTCTPDGTEDVTYVNPGFSRGGAEVVQDRKTLKPEQLGDLWSAAQELAKARPDARESPDASWNATSAIFVVLSDGARLTFSWPAGGTHPDPRAARLAGLLIKLL